MRHFTIIATLLLSMLLPTQASALISWKSDLDEAKQLARQTNRLVLVHFWSDDCPPCRRVEKNVFPRSDVQRSMDSGYVAVKIHGKQMSHLTERYNVRGWPTDIIMTPDGEELYRTWSPQKPQDYIRLLDTVAAHARVNRRATASLAERQTARTPQSANAPGQRPMKQYTASGLADRQNPVAPHPTHSNTFNASHSRPAAQPPQAPQPQPTAGASRYGAAPPNHQARQSVQSNPYVDRQTQTAPDAPTASRYGSAVAASVAAPAAATPQPTDPESRYGARNPRQQQTTPAGIAAARADNLGNSASARTNSTSPGNGATQASRYGAPQQVAATPPNAAPSQSPANDTTAPGASRYGGGIIAPSAAQAAPAATVADQRSRYSANAPGANAAAPNAPAATRPANPAASPQMSRYAPGYAQRPAANAAAQQPPRGQQPFASQQPGNQPQQQFAQQQFAQQQPGTQPQYGQRPAQPTGQRAYAQPGQQPPAAPNQQPAPVAMRNLQVALDGFCPVTLQEQRKWQRGDARFAARHRGKIYHCAGERELTQFKANPDFFCPLLSGFDPVKLIQENQLVPGRREFGMWHDNAMLLFADEASLHAFWSAPDRYMPAVRQAMAAPNTPWR